MKTFKLIFINQNGGHIELGTKMTIEEVKKLLSTNPYKICYNTINEIYYDFFKVFINKINNLNKPDEIVKAFNNYIYNGKILIN